MASTRRVLRGTMALLVVAVLAGCAAGGLPPPRKMQQEDFKRLAGEWRGTAYVEQEIAAPIMGVIFEGGSFYTAPRSVGALQVPGMMKVVDGEVLYEGPHSRGKMTFHEAPSEWIWKWNGRTKMGDRAVTNELRKSK